MGDCMNNSIAVARLPTLKSSKNVTEMSRLLINIRIFSSIYDYILNFSLVHCMERAAKTEAEAYVDR